MSVKKVLQLCILSSVPTFSALGCDVEVFGFKLGEPVPDSAIELKIAPDFFLQGGYGNKNVMRSFLGNVPKPMQEFNRYAFWANVDRKVVYGVTAIKDLTTVKYDKTAFSKSEQRDKLWAEAKLKLKKLVTHYEEKYGFKYSSTFKHGLTFEAENSLFRSKIAALPGDVIYIDCENKKLHKKAYKVALKSTLGG